jgi:hypothetical protein
MLWSIMSSMRASTSTSTHIAIEVISRLMMRDGGGGARYDGPTL